jgi:hypothetical protein
VVRGTGLLSRICGLAASLPPAADKVAIRVDIEADDRGETWRRHFGDLTMSSRLCARGGCLRSASARPP